MPAELRLIIYDYYFSSFIILWSPPPILKVCSLLRVEAVVFYRARTATYLSEHCARARRSVANCKKCGCDWCYFLLKAKFEAVFAAFKPCRGEWHTGPSEYRKVMKEMQMLKDEFEELRRLIRR